MHYTPRTIAFHCELLHPAWTPDASAVQRVHNRLFQDGQPLYRSFEVRHEGIVLANPTGPGALSQAIFLGDRVRFIEEHTGLLVEGFSQRIQRLVELATAERPVPLFTGQVVTVRTLINPRNHASGAGYLHDGLLGLGDALSEFERPAQGLGLRLSFGPRPGEPNAFGVRVESLPQDPRSLFIESQGTFPPIPMTATVIQSGTPVDIPTGLEAIEQNVRATYVFATERVPRFLQRFDEAREEPQSE